MSNHLQNESEKEAKKTYWIKFKNNTNCQKWKQYFYVNQKMITVIL